MKGLCPTGEQTGSHKSCSVCKNVGKTESVQISCAFRISEMFGHMNAVAGPDFLLFTLSLVTFSNHFISKETTFTVHNPSKIGYFRREFVPKGAKSFL